jgi:hypothetical protein
MRFEAAIHGVAVDKKEESETLQLPETKGTAPPIQSSIEKMMLFQDPSDYAHFSQEEKEVLTAKMMGVHRKVMTKTPVGRE